MSVLRHNMRSIHNAQDELSFELRPGDDRPWLRWQNTRFPTGISSFSAASLRRLHECLRTRDALGRQQLFQQSRGDDSRRCEYRFTATLPPLLEVTISWPGMESEPLRWAFSKSQCDRLELFLASTLSLDTEPRPAAVPLRPVFGL